MESLRKLPLLGRSIGVPETITECNAEQIHTFTQSIPVKNQSYSQNYPSGFAPWLMVKDIGSTFNL